MAAGDEFEIEMVRPDQAEEMATFINKHFAPYETMVRVHFGTPLLKLNLFI